VRCLVVDASATQRRILALALNRAGWTETAEAPDAAGALAQCSEDLVAVVTEWDLPDMNGLELIAKLREGSGRPHLPALVVSSRRREEDVMTAMNAGIRGYLLKPFEAAALDRWIGVLVRAAAESETPPAEGEGLKRAA
jgi:two-component system chemotaxis response regulator CheY